jgi:regulator of protease activity HflC (stomatin/prohibitin superfamily)
MDEKATSHLRRSGIRLIESRLGPLQTPASVAEQHLKFWQADGQRQVAIIRAEGEATILEENELARAEAEAAMIQAIYEGVQRARREGSGAAREIIALRLIEALEKMARQSQLLVGPTGGVIQDLQDIRGQLPPPPPTGTAIVRRPGPEK